MNRETCFTLLCQLAKRVFMLTVETLQSVSKRFHFLQCSCACLPRLARFIVQLLYFKLLTTRTLANNGAVVAFASLPSPPSAHTVPLQPSKKVHMSSHIRPVTWVITLWSRCCLISRLVHAMLLAIGSETIVH